MMSSIPRVKTEKHFAEHDSVCRSKTVKICNNAKCISKFLSQAISCSRKGSGTSPGPGPGPALCGKLRCFVLRACAPSSMKDKPDSAALCPDKKTKGSAGGGVLIGSEIGTQSAVPDEVGDGVGC
ncbi:hypothetical protein AAG906_014078 [Vitis piasezkii]